MSEQYPLEEITIGQMLRRSARQFAQRPALEYCGRIWSYKEFDFEVDRTAQWLLTLGVEKGDHVGLLCEAGPNAIFVLYAIFRIGAVAVMLNSSLLESEVRQLLQQTDVHYLVVGEEHRDLGLTASAPGLKTQLPALRQIIHTGETPCSKGYGSSQDDLPALAMLHAAEQAVQVHDTASILFTSGTTGKPKAVMTDHFSRVNNAIQQVRDLDATEQDRFCMALPMFHCFSLTVNVLGTRAVGACLVLPKSRRTTVLLETVSQSKCTVMSCVPTLYRAMLCREDFETWDLSSLRAGYIGGSMYPPELFCEIDRRFQMTLVSSLGQTEATGGLTSCHLWDPLEARATTVGPFIANAEGKVVDTKTGQEQPIGETGEICVRGYLVMQGYYGQPEETAKSVDADGWLHTGDLGFLDEKGYVHLTGRLKELIIRGGENIAPGEIERVLLSDPRIEEAKAVGVPDVHYTEEVCACVVATGPITEEEIRDLARQRLAPFKVPRYVLLFDSFPQTAVGKIDGKEVRRIALERLCPNG